MEFLVNIQEKEMSIDCRISNLTITASSYLSDVLVGTAPERHELIGVPEPITASGDVTLQLPLGILQQLLSLHLQKGKSTMIQRMK